MRSDKQKHCSISIHAGRWPEQAAYLRRKLKAAIAQMKAPLEELSVVLVGDSEIAELHQQFFNDPTTTDVITFPIDVCADGLARSGELYLCAPMARRQAQQRGIKLRDELLLYGLHGVLHLSGYDDLTPREYKRMHKKEDEILERIGARPVFSTTAQATASESRAGGRKGARAGRRRGAGVAGKAGR